MYNTSDILIQRTSVYLLLAIHTNPVSFACASLGFMFTAHSLRGEKSYFSMNIVDFSPFLHIILGAIRCSMNEHVKKYIVVRSSPTPLFLMTFPINVLPCSNAYNSLLALLQFPYGSCFLTRRHHILNNIQEVLALKLLLHLLNVSFPLTNYLVWHSLPQLITFLH